MNRGPLGDRLGAFPFEHFQIFVHIAAHKIHFLSEMIWNDTLKVLIRRELSLFDDDHVSDPYLESNRNMELWFNRVTVW